MAGWIKKKRLGGNVQKLWEDKKAYGTGFHEKLFNEGIEDMEEKKKKDKDLKECGDVSGLDRIAQLTSPDSGGDIDDEYDDEEDEVTIKIATENDKEDEDEDTEELEEGVITDLLSVLGIKIDNNMQRKLRDKDAQEAIQRILANTDKLEVGTGTMSPIKQAASAKSRGRALSMGESDTEIDTDGELDEAIEGEGKLNQILRSDVMELFYNGLSSIVSSGEATDEQARNLLSGMIESVRRGLGGESDTLKGMRQDAQGRGNPLADETDEDKLGEEDEESKDEDDSKEVEDDKKDDDKEEKKIDEEDESEDKDKEDKKEDEKELDEAMMMFKGVSDQSEKLAKDLMHRFITSVGKSRQIKSAKTNIGKPALRAKHKMQRTLSAGEYEENKS